MSVLESVILGVVQGLTEFLPVSSSGHLVLAQGLLGVRLPGVGFEIVVHVATLCAVLWVYRERVRRLALGVVGRERDSLRYVGLLLLASIPAGVVGLLGSDFLEAQFERPPVAAALLLVTGALVYTTRWTARGGGRAEPDAGRALLIGAAQAAAILPGISRSGSTVAVGTWLGVEPVRMAEFSFLMSVPAIGGAAMLQAGDLADSSSLIGNAALASGFAAALLSGVAAIRIFVRMLRSVTFHRFAYYCWAAGLGYLTAAAFLPELRG